MSQIVLINGIPIDCSQGMSIEMPRQIGDAPVSFDFKFPVPKTVDEKRIEVTQILRDFSKSHFSNHQIAKEVGVSHTVVAKYRAAIERQEREIEAVLVKEPDIFARWKGKQISSQDALDIYYSRLENNKPKTSFYRHDGKRGKLSEIPSNTRKVA